MTTVPARLATKLHPRPCTYCEAPAEYLTCCGGVADGSAGHTCDHEDGEAVCAACWTTLEASGHVSSAH